MRTEEFKISFLRILVHSPIIIFFTGMLIWTEILMIEKGGLGLLLIYIPLIFGVFIVPMSYVLIQYIKEDWDKKIEITDTKLIIYKGNSRTEINTMTEITSHTSVSAGGFRNPFLGYGFLEIVDIKGNKHYVSSLICPPQKIAEKLYCGGKQLTIGFPRIGLNTEGKGIPS